MSMGIMGIGAQFMQAGCAKAQQISNYISYWSNQGDETIQISVSSPQTIIVISTKNGSQIKQKYQFNTGNYSLSIQSDINSEIKILGDIYDIILASNTTRVNLLNAPSLAGITIDGSQIEELDLSAQNHIESVSANNCANLGLIKVYSDSENVAYGISDAISGSHITTGTLYTNSDGAYYNTIATAATNKGWTIEQL